MAASVALRERVEALRAAVSSRRDWMVVSMAARAEGVVASSGFWGSEVGC